MKKAPMLVTCMAAVIASVVLLSEKPQEQKKSTLMPSSAVSMPSYSTSNTLSSQETSSAMQTVASAVSGSEYLVREYHGHIGVYRVGENTPFQEYETDVNLLPEPDRLELKHGKPAATMAEVEKIIEDYDG